MKSSHSVIVLAISFAFIASFVSAAPQASSSVEVSSNKYSPYNFEYKVEDAEQKVYHDRTESQDDNGEVTGRYSVWLPDGRLMIVEYTAGASGFVPKITFMENANPFG